MKNLIQGSKEGRLSKKLALIIVRKLLRRGTVMDPELLDLVGE